MRKEKRKKIKTYLKPQLPGEKYLAKIIRTELLTDPILIASAINSVKIN